MPAVISLSEFNRNQAEVIERLSAMSEPLYLTRNGRAVVVVMDAEAFDREQARRDEMREREMATYASLLEGYQDVLDGRTMSLDALDARVRAKKGWER